MISFVLSNTFTIIIFKKIILCVNPLGVNFGVICKTQRRGGGVGGGKKDLVDLFNPKSISTFFQSFKVLPILKII